MKFPKHTYIRSEKLRRLVASLHCQRCGSPHYVQASHANWGGGKGMGIKADDNLIAALCQSCHQQIDQGSTMSRERKKEVWYEAHRKTVFALVDSGRWPVDIPIPKESQWSDDGE